MLTLDTMEKLRKIVLGTFTPEDLRVFDQMECEPPEPTPEGIEILHTYDALRAEGMSDEEALVEINRRTAR